MHMFTIRQQCRLAAVSLALVATAVLLAPGALRDVAEPAAPPPQRATATALRVQGDAETLLRRVALNALLAPLLDADTVQMRWADPALVPGCDAASAVRIDGTPLVVGAAVPGGAFTLTSVMVDCSPFGNASVAPSGTAILQVTPGENGTHTAVHAEHLRIDGAPAGPGLVQPFAAFLAHAPAGSDALRRQSLRHHV